MEEKTPINTNITYYQSEKTAKALILSWLYCLACFTIYSCLTIYRQLEVNHTKKNIFINTVLMFNGIGLAKCCFQERIPVNQLKESYTLYTLYFKKSVLMNIMYSILH